MSHIHGRTSVRANAVKLAAAACAAALVGSYPFSAARADITGDVWNPANITSNRGGNAIAQGGFTPIQNGNGQWFEYVMTTNSGSENGSVYWNTPQNITNFTATWNYQANVNSNSINSAADGFTFVLQNDPRGKGAFGDGGGSLAYAGGGSNWIQNSVADTFNVYQGNGDTGSQIQTLGHVGIYNKLNPTIEFKSGGTNQITLQYDQASKRMVETVSGFNNPADGTSYVYSTLTRVYTNVDIAGQVGSNTAYVGFTAATGGVAVGQTLHNFSFTTNTASIPGGPFKPDMTPIAVSGFNQDMIVDNVAPNTATGTISGSTSPFVTATMDGGTAKTGNTFYQIGYARNQLNTGIPAGQTVQSQNHYASQNSTVTFQPANANNAVMMDASHLTGQLSMNDNTNRYSAAAIYATDGNGAANVTATLHFSDGHADVSLPAISVHDWFGGTNDTFNYGWLASGRTDPNGALNNLNSNNPRIYEYDVDLTPYIRETISSVSFAWGGSGGSRTAIWALSGAIDPAHNLTWNQSTGGAWNTTTSNKPWSENAAANFFTSGDNANFTDVAVGSVAIDPNGVYPKTTNVSNTTGTYTFTGGSIGLGSLNKSNAGTLTLANAANTFTDATISGGVVNVGSGGVVNKFTSTGTLNVGNGASLVITPSTAATPTSLTHSFHNINLNTSGTVDIGNSSISVDTTGTSTAAQVRSYLVSGYNGGNWNTPGINSSVVSALNNNPANPNLKQYAIGYAAAGQLNVVPTVPAGTVLVRPTLFGDTNMDGKVDNADISAIVAAGHYMDGSTNNSWAVGDWNYDGKVDNNDISMLVASGNYMSGKTYNGAPAAGGAVRLTSAAVAKNGVTTVGVSGDGIPDYVYDPSTGDVRFRTDGVSGLVQEVHIKSASGQLNYQALFTADPNAGFGQDVVNANEIDLFRQGPDPRTGQTRQFPDNYDFGTILGLNLTQASLLQDLTLSYTINGGGISNQPSDLIGGTGGVPEPTSLALIGVAAAGLLGRRKRRN